MIETNFTACRALSMSSWFFVAHRKESSNRPADSNRDPNSLNWISPKCLILTTSTAPTTESQAPWSWWNQSYVSNSLSISGTYCP